MSDIVAMNNIAKHRGPDDEGYLVVSKNEVYSLKGSDSCDELDYYCCVNDYILKDNEDFLVFGHRRLSIIDLTADGHQPMCLREMNLSITYNGEIYNYIELRKELEAYGYNFSTNTDTEVVLMAYHRWGEECVNHFNGMWGFAIWDGDSRKLFCSRDRFGAKPFYYAVNEGEFIFASEIKQLCQNPNINRVINESVMVNQIMWNISDYNDETLIKDIKVLEGGYNIRIYLDETYQNIINVEKYRYWDVNVESKQNYCERNIKELLRNAIRLRTRSDAPIGVLLSGGLDSSCIVSEISSMYKEQGIKSKELNTFTSCYNNFDEGNELKYAKIVNEYCGTSPNYIYPDESDTLGVYNDLVWYLEGNCGFGVIGNYLLLKEIANTGVKVLINGQGSDETMFGYERYYAWYFKDLAKKGKVLDLILSLNQARKNSRLSLKMLIQYFFYFSFIKLRKRRCLKRMRPYIKSTVTKSFNQEEEIIDYINNKSLKELQYNELRRIQLTHILRMDDRLYMSNSLESRVPFIDYRYVESVVGIPAEKKIQEGYTKYILRKIFDKELPDEIIWRKNKMGWPSPVSRWAKRFDDNKMEELFKTAKTRKYFNIDSLRELYKTKPGAYPIEKFVNVELFVRNFNVTV